MKKLSLAAICILTILVVLPPAALQAAEPNSIVVAGQDANIPVGMEVDSMVVFAGNAYVSGRVKDSVVAIGGNVVLEPGAEVYGDVVSLGGTIETRGDARIGGQQVSLGSFSLKNLEFSPVLGRWFGFNFSIWRLLSVLFLGMVAFWLFPQGVELTSAALNQNPLRSVLFGLLAYLALIPLTLLMIITILGIPLVPILWLLVATGRLLGQVALALIAGEWLAQMLKLQTTRPYHVLLGLIALGVLTFLPVVGGLASLFYSLVGFGAVTWTRFGTKAVAH